MDLQWKLNKNDVLTVAWALGIATALNAGNTRAENVHAIELHERLNKLLRSGLLDH
jgi:hypothetical protein